MVTWLTIRNFKLDALVEVARAALLTLGQGFLAHPDNHALRAALNRDELSTRDCFNQLLLLAYRMIFLLIVEERALLHPVGTDKTASTLYLKDYSMGRLRDVAVMNSPDDGLSDLWDRAKTVFRGLEHGDARLGLPALAGFFTSARCSALDAATLDNRSLLLAVSKLSWLQTDAGLVRVNWRDVSPEELGCVYESLLKLVPEIPEGSRTLVLPITATANSSARRSTGSYYTPDSLVQVVLDSALEPVIAETIAKHPEKPDLALLELAIVDPACGSGHFLLAAARRVASHVARLSIGAATAAPDVRHAMRQVVAHCIYGIDINPMAVELCKVGLWMEAAIPGLPLTFLDSHIQLGNALLGTTPELMAEGVPNAAWNLVDGDDRKTAIALKKRNRTADGTLGITIPGSIKAGHQKFVADAWCSAFVWPKRPGAIADAAPTNDVWQNLRDGRGQPSALTAETVEKLSQEYGFFHWHLAFPLVFARGGFDVVLGNPPWIAHAGRAAQALPAGIKRFFEYRYESFADYPTTHGMFASTAPTALRPGGRLGVVIPSSLSELDGYAPTRRAHDRLCEFVGDLVDFGEGRFPGVTQPCMALVSRRAAGGRTDAAHGDPWPMARPDLTETDRKLLARLESLPTLPGELFGERGVQSDKSLAAHFVESSVPVDRFITPIREGTDVREFELLRPRHHVDPIGLGGRMRSAEEFRAVRVLIRQTARYPIAAVSDGLAFRNSLLAGLEHPEWPADALMALLNSALVRWAHYMRFRDARQPVLPQVKIGHLRSIPAPLGKPADRMAELAVFGRRLAECRVRPPAADDREELDRLVAELYDLCPEELAAVTRWHDEVGPRAQRSTSDLEAKATSTVPCSLPPSSSDTRSPSVPAGTATRTRTV
jgi:hypothetical protein